MKQLVGLMFLFVATKTQDIYFPYDKETFTYPPFPRGPYNVPPAIQTNEIPSYPDRTLSSQIDSIISSGVNNLGFGINNELHLGRERATYDRDNPVVFSPLSIAEALSLILIAATGHTFDELSKLLGFNNKIDISQNSQALHEEFGRMLASFNSIRNDPDRPQLSAASAVFVQEGFPIRNEFRTLATQAYQSEVYSLNFVNNGNGAKNVINNWVSRKTNGKIENILVEAPLKSTLAVLASALYFKGKWLKPFIAELTMKHAFYPYGRNNKTSVTIDMMGNAEEFNYYYDPKLDVEMIELPYVGQETSMYIVVPKLSSKQKLRDLEAQLSEPIIDQLISHLKLKYMILAMPKMRLESTIELNSVISDLGVETLFDPSSSHLNILSSATNVNTQVDKDLIDRNGEVVNVKNSNCTRLFETDNSITSCVDMLSKRVNNKTKVIYKRFGNKIGRRFARAVTKRATIDDLRNSINKDPYAVNPGLYLDQVIHKVFIDITETGTEAAAATAGIINRSGTLTVRLDHPFMFFIRHKKTKLNLFYGSITVPTPYTA